MKRLSVIAHLPHEEVGRRYRRCPDPKEKTRWHLLWLLLRPGEPLSCEQAGPLVGLPDVHARAVLKRWNAQGPDGLADRRKHNKGHGRLTPAQQADLRRYVKAVFQAQEGQENSARLKNILEEDVGLAEAGRGNALLSVRGTLWAAYNGVAEWLAYHRGRSGDNRLNSLWFGDGAGLNRRALEEALGMAG